MRISDWSSDVCSSDLVPPIGAAGAARDLGHVVQAEREQHGLLEPLVDAPAARAIGLGNTRRAGIELRQRLIDRLTHRPLGLAADRNAVLPGGVDRRLKAIGRASRRERVCPYV